MKTSILTRHREIDETLKRYIQTRIAGALSALVARISVVVVKLNSVTENNGDRLKACDIEIDLNGQSIVVASSKTSNWLAAIDQAIESAARAVRRQVGKLNRITPVESPRLFRLPIKSRAKRDQH